MATKEPGRPNSEPHEKNPVKNKMHKKNVLIQQVEKKAQLKLQAKQRKNAGVWFGLGMMGIIGWSIVIPTLIGVSIGVWLDNNYDVHRSWTLALLLAGLTTGCLLAWSWISKEHNAIHDDSKSIKKED